MTRHVYINWNLLSETKPKETNKIYMVATPMIEDAVVEYSFAKFYEKGNVVNMIFRDDYNETSDEELSKMSAEERLLHTLFERKLDFEIPESGFYIERDSRALYDEYGDEYEMFLCCECGLLMLDSSSFWSDTPIAPEGFKTTDQHAKLTVANANIIRKEHESESCAKLSEKMEEDTYYKLAYQSAVHDCDLSFEKQSIGVAYGGIYNISTIAIANRASVVREFFSLLQCMNENNITFDSVGADLDKLSKGQTVEAYKNAVHTILDPIFDCAKLTSKTKPLAWIAFMDNRHRFKDDIIEFDDYRKRMMLKYNGQKSKICEILIDAKSYYSMSNSAYRINTLMSLKAPQIIIENEFRMMSAGIISILCKPFLSDVNHEIFSKYFGVTPNYTKYEYNAHDDCDVEEIEEQDVVDLSINLFRPKIELGFDIPYFTIVYSPNYLMFDGEFAIFNNETNDYYKDADNKIPVFNCYVESKKLRDSLEKSKKRKKH